MNRRRVLVGLITQVFGIIAVSAFPKKAEARRKPSNNYSDYYGSYGSYYGSFGMYGNYGCYGSYGVYGPYGGYGMYGYGPYYGYSVEDTVQYYQYQNRQPNSLGKTKGPWSNNYFEVMTNKSKK